MKQELNQYKLLFLDLWLSDISNAFSVLKGGGGSEECTFQSWAIEEEKIPYSVFAYFSKSRKETFSLFVSVHLYTSKYWEIAWEWVE